MKFLPAAKEAFSSRETMTWQRLAVITLLSAYAFIFMEWLFTITRPSFMRTLGAAKQIEILFFTASLTALVSLVPVALAALISRVRPLKRIEPALQYAAGLIPALILSSMLLLLIDNFTYTLFKFGIVSTRGLLRVVYALLFLALTAASYRFVLREGVSTAIKIQKKLRTSVLIPGITAFCLVPLLIPVMLGEYAFLTERVTSTAGSRTRPYILFITSDGVSATHVSAYGYERNTTPVISSLAESSLLAENTFSNSGNTSGSIIASITGKYPSNTRVLYPPDILHGMDAYEHLPGILKANGYYTAQISYPYFVDAYTLNVLEGFDMVNGRTESTGLQIKLRQYLPNDYAYFVYETANRLMDRLRHIFFIKDMVNPYDLVTKDPDPIADQVKFDELFYLLETSQQPLFIHLHAMGTHGAEFYPEKQVFSAGKNPKNQEPWDGDFYDDSILEFDGYIGRLIDELKRLGLYENTILIVSSDHPLKYEMTQRVPLLIHFPGDQHAGTLHDNVQAIDLAPTLLDYMGIKAPEWMEGKSLLSGEPGERPIFGFGVGTNATSIEGKWKVNPEKVKPPFYQFQTITLEYCQVYYYLNLEKKELSTGEVAGSTAGCPASELPSQQQVMDWMTQHLDQHGFDISSLK